MPGTAFTNVGKHTLDSTLVYCMTNFKDQKDIDLSYRGLSGELTLPWLLRRLSENCTLKLAGNDLGPAYFWRHQYAETLLPGSGATASSRSMRRAPSAMSAPREESSVASAAPRPDDAPAMRTRLPDQNCGRAAASAHSDSMRAAQSVTSV